MTTVFVAPEAWGGERLELAGAIHHHLFRVGRLAVGDSLRLADGAGRARVGVVERVTRSTAEVLLGTEVASHEPAVRVQLLVVAPKKPRAEWLVEKTTELGVASVRFLHSERGPRSIGDGSFERLRRIARSAAEQSGRARIPEVSGMHQLAEVRELLEGSRAAYVLDPAATRLAPATKADSISLLIGPEGGWSSRELAAFAEIGVEAAGLGPRILRVETAAAVAVFACVIAD